MCVFFVLGSWSSVLDTAGRWLGFIGIMGWLIGGFTSSQSCDNSREVGANMRVYYAC